MVNGPHVELLQWFRRMLLQDQHGIQIHPVQFGLLLHGSRSNVNWLLSKRRNYSWASFHSFRSVVGKRGRWIRPSTSNVIGVRVLFESSCFVVGPFPVCRNQGLYSSGMGIFCSISLTFCGACFRKRRFRSGVNSFRTKDVASEPRASANRLMVSPRVRDGAG